MKFIHPIDDPDTILRVLRLVMASQSLVPRSHEGVGKHSICYHHPRSSREISNMAKIQTRYCQFPLLQYLTKSRNLEQPYRRGAEHFRALSFRIDQNCKPKVANSPSIQGPIVEYLLSLRCFYVSRILSFAAASIS
jgi:hypothetical protein